MKHLNINISHSFFSGKEKNTFGKIGKCNKKNMKADTN